MDIWKGTKLMFYYVLYGLNKYFDFIGVWYREVADKEEVSCDRISRIIRQDKET